MAIRLGKSAAKEDSVRGQGFGIFSSRNRSSRAGMRVRGIWWLALVTLVIALGIGSAASTRKISGTYFASSPTSAFLVVVAQTNGHQLTGRYEHVELQPSGELEDTNKTLTGAVDNGTVVATLKPNDLLSDILSEAVTVSGTFDGKVLHLAGSGGGGTLSLDLLKADESAFRAQITKLTAQASQIRAQKSAL